ncbi:hypothetical protein PFISCL1PPCAC_17874, partial [Pristionchus fissidentatus]
VGLRVIHGRCGLDKNRIGSSQFAFGSIEQNRCRAAGFDASDFLSSVQLFSTELPLIHRCGATESIRLYWSVFERSVRNQNVGEICARLARPTSLSVLKRRRALALVHCIMGEVVFGKVIGEISWTYVDEIGALRARTSPSQLSIDRRHFSPTGRCDPFATSGANSGSEFVISNKKVSSRARGHFGSVHARSLRWDSTSVHEWTVDIAEGSRARDGWRRLEKSHGSCALESEPITVEYYEMIEWGADTILVNSDRGVSRTRKMEVAALAIRLCVPTDVVERRRRTGRIRGGDCYRSSYPR